MTFLNPWLLVGLAGISVPVVIHLLNRFRHRQMDWAAMELLRRAIVQRSRQIKMEDILLLLLRCLAVILIVLAIARPVIRTAAARWLGGKDIGVVLAVDASYSMEHRPGVQSRFGRAQERAGEILRTLPPGTPLSVVLIGDRPRVLLRNAAYDPAAVFRVMKDAATLPERLNMDRCLEQVEHLVLETKAAQRECYIVTDCQAASWGELSARAKETLQRIGRESRLCLVDCSDSGRENIAITRLEQASGLAARGMTGRFLAELRNTGEQPRRGVELTLTVNDRAVDRRMLELLEPGRSQSVALFVPYETAGPVRIAARIPPDALAADNERFATATVLENLRVLVLEGRGSAGKEAADFIAYALAPPGMPAASRPRVDRVSWSGRPVSRPQEYQLLVMAGSDAPDAAQVRALEEYVRNGGNILFFMGQNVTDAETFNRAFSTKAEEALEQMRQQTGQSKPEQLAQQSPRQEQLSRQAEQMAEAAGKALLLPARLVKRIRNDRATGGRGWTAAPASEHRLSALLGLLPRPLLDELIIREAFQLETVGGGKTILKLAGTEFPLLAEKTIGRGKVFLCATAADRQWGNFPIHPLFPMLVNEILACVSASPLDRGFTVGEPLAVSAPPRSLAETAAFHDPAGQTNAVTLSVAGDGRREARFDEPTVPGFYEVAFSAEAAPALLAVNVDAAEASVAPLAAEALAGALPGVTFRRFGGGDDLTAAVREIRTGKELWRALVLLALVVLLLESFLAWKFGKRAALKEAAMPGRFRSAPVAAAAVGEVS